MECLGFSGKLMNSIGFTGVGLCELRGSVDLDLWRFPLEQWASMAMGLEGTEKISCLGL